MTDLNEEAELLALHATIAKQREASLSAVQAMSLADLQVELVLLQARTELLKLKGDALERGELPASVFDQTMRDLNAISPLVLHQAIEMELDDLLGRSK